MGRGGDRKTTACEVHEGPSRWNQFDMLLTRYPLPQKIIHLIKRTIRLSIYNPQSNSITNKKD